jgi:hypothetical protein
MAWPEELAQVVYFGMRSELDGTVVNAGKWYARNGRRENRTLISSDRRHAGIGTERVTNLGQDIAFLCSSAGELIESTGKGIHEYVS